MRRRIRNISEAFQTCLGCSFLIPCKTQCVVRVSDWLAKQEQFVPSCSTRCSLFASSYQHTSFGFHTPKINHSVDQQAGFSGFCCGCFFVSFFFFFSRGWIYFGTKGRVAKQLPELMDRRQLQEHPEMFHCSLAV